MTTILRTAATDTTDAMALMVGVVNHPPSFVPLGGVVAIEALAGARGMLAGRGAMVAMVGHTMVDMVVTENMIIIVDKVVLVLVIVVTEDVIVLEDMIVHVVAPHTVVVDSNRGIRPALK